MGLRSVRPVTSDRNNRRWRRVCSCRKPGVGLAVDHRVNPFCVRGSRAEELRGLLHDRRLRLELTDLLPSGAPFGRLYGRGARDLAAVDPVLSKPRVQTPGGDLEFESGLVDLLAGTDKRDRPSTELGRVGTRHRSKPRVVLSVLGQGLGVETLGMAGELIEGDLDFATVGETGDQGKLATGGQDVRSA